jgi:hypothetical protein
MKNETTTTNNTPQEGRNNRRTLLMIGGKSGCRPGTHDGHRITAIAGTEVVSLALTLLFLAAIDGQPDAPEHAEHG